MKSLVCLILLILLPSVLHSEPGDVSGETSPPPLYLAQNTQQEDTDTASTDNGTEVTPLPPARFTITPEKPVKGVPGEKKPEEAVSDGTPESAAQSPAVQSDGVTAAVPGPPLTPSTPASTVTLPDSTAAGKTEAKTGVPPDIMNYTAVEEKLPSKLMEELSIVNVPTANFRTMKYVIDEEYGLRGAVYGDEQGYIRILNADGQGNFREVWKSPPCNSPIRGVFVQDLAGDGRTQVVAYTSDGNFYIYDYESHDLMYRTPEGTYQNINCMVVANMDDDPQMELFFIGVKPGTNGTANGNPAGIFVQFDPLNQFEEWVSTNLYTATDMLIGNVDTDPEPEIILNTGEILSLRFKDVEWKCTFDLGSRLYLIDLDSDDILELVSEYGESYIRVIDVDQRQEKW